MAGASSSPLPEDLLQAAEIVRNILENAEAEKRHSFHGTEGEDEKGQIDAAHCSFDELAAPALWMQCRQRQCQDLRAPRNSDKRQLSQEQHQHLDCHQGSEKNHEMEPTSHRQQVPTLRGRPSLRRPGRPPRKRQHRVYCPGEDYHGDSSTRADLLRLAEVGLMHAEKSTKKESSDKAKNVEGTISSTIRVLSSETYLRRLFVTASLARVLSLDKFLPRSMPNNKRACSSRVVGRGAEGNGREEGGPLDEQKGFARGNGDDGANVPSYDDSADDGYAIAFDSGQFKTYFPVTLIDEAGKRWNVTYVTTRRDNLYSGRLTDGWERFCCARGLRVGDVVKFVKVETSEQNQGARGCRKEAVAKVFMRGRR